MLNFTLWKRLLGTRWSVLVISYWTWCSIQSWIIKCLLYNGSKDMLIHTTNKHICSKKGYSYLKSKIIQCKRKITVVLNKLKSLQVYTLWKEINGILQQVTISQLTYINVCQAILFSPKIKKVDRNEKTHQERKRFASFFK